MSLVHVIRSLAGGASIYDYWPGIAATRHPSHPHPLVVEIGVHHGDDTRELTRTSPTGALDWIGFEPDPRNLAVLADRDIRVVAKAVSDTEGEAELWLSSGWTPGSNDTRWHTDSSSLNTPTAHLETAPWCRFDERASVTTTRLDTALADQGDTPIDLVWVDVQGAQRKVIAGGAATLRRTRYLYIECHPTPMYEGEPTFEELCALLPDFAVVKRWPGEVLFRNRAMPVRVSRHDARVVLLELAALVVRPALALWRRRHG